MTTDYIAISGPEESFLFEPFLAATGIVCVDNGKREGRNDLMCCFTTVDENLKSSICIICKSELNMRVQSCSMQMNFKI